MATPNKPRRQSARFTDRRTAGEALGRALAHLRGEDVVVLALPRGGVPVAAPIAETLGAALDLVVVRKIGVPFQPELAMGAILDGDPPVVVRNEDVIDLAGVGEAAFERGAAAALREADRRRKRYQGDRRSAPVENRVVVVVDDGIATGATMRAAIKALRRKKPKRIALAIPVAPAETVAALKDDADDIVCLMTPRPFHAIGLYYEDFTQVDDETVRRLLAEARKRRAEGI